MYEILKVVVTVAFVVVVGITIYQNIKNKKK